MSTPNSVIEHTNYYTQNLTKHMTANLGYMYALTKDSLVLVLHYFHTPLLCCNRMSLLAQTYPLQRGSP